MDDKHDIGRIKNIDDLKISPIGCLPEHKIPTIARPSRVRRPSMTHYVLGITRFYTVAGNVFDIPPIPPELVHHLVYTKMAVCQISLRVSGELRIVDPTASYPAAGT